MCACVCVHVCVCMCMCACAHTRNVQYINMCGGLVVLLFYLPETASMMFLPTDIVKVLRNSIILNGEWIIWSIFAHREHN